MEASTDSFHRNIMFVSAEIQALKDLGRERHLVSRLSHQCPVERNQLGHDYTKSLNSCLKLTLIEALQ